MYLYSISVPYYTTPSHTHIRHKWGGESHCIPLFSGSIVAPQQWTKILLIADCTAGLSILSIMGNPSFIRS
jgi:hypothetical protein